MIRILKVVLATAAVKNMISSKEPITVHGVKYKIDQSLVKTPNPKNKSVIAVWGRRILVLGAVAGLIVASIASKVVLIVVASTLGAGGVGFAGLIAAMKYSTAFKNKVISMVLPNVMKIMDKAMKNVKLELLKDIRGDVLDFGAGDGQYLQYIAKCKDNVKSIVSLEPIPQLHDKIRQRADDLGLKTDVFGGFSSQLLKERGPDQFDFIIIGNVLCEVPNQREALQDLYKMLRPGGKAYFLEHIAHEKGTLDRTLEETINPVWRIISGGCNCNRETLKKVVIPDWQVYAWELHTAGPFISRHVAGLLLKEGKSNL